MSIEILFDNPPPFYTNLDVVKGIVRVRTEKPTTIGAIIVKLEGESDTMISPNHDTYRYQGASSRRLTPSSNAEKESHKILYKVQRVFPNIDQATDALVANFILDQGIHEWPFEFKIPFNNACGDMYAMSQLGGVSGIGGIGSGVRVMDGSKQLFLQHVLKGLPPSLTGMRGIAQIRYYVKCTVQRPFMRENWRKQVDFRFMPIERVRDPPSTSMVYAKRPFVFPQRHSNPRKEKKRAKKQKYQEGTGPIDDTMPLPAQLEVIALLPSPTVITCNQPIPLVLRTRKISPSEEMVYLVALEITLLSDTLIRCHEAESTDLKRWILFSQAGLCITVADPHQEVMQELTLPNDLWKNLPLPNTVHPTFYTCNLRRSYRLEVRIGLSRNRPAILGVDTKPPSSGWAALFRYSPKETENRIPNDTIMLPLSFVDVEILSGVTPPPALVEEVLRRRSLHPFPKENSLTSPHQHNEFQSAFPVDNNPFVAPPTSPNSATPGNFWPRNRYSQATVPPHSSTEARPPLPPRRPGATAEAAAAIPLVDPLYPPQLGTDAAESWQWELPSYEDALMEQVGDAQVGEDRPAYSGMTDVNAARVGESPLGQAEQVSQGGAQIGAVEKGGEIGRLQQVGQ